jgi:hypothetical protein
MAARGNQRGEETSKQDGFYAEKLGADVVKILNMLNNCFLGPFGGRVWA